MRPIAVIFFLCSILIISKTGTTQNVSINVLTQNSGYVALGGSVFVEITISNTSTTTAVAQYKLRPQLSVPVSIAGIPVSGHILPSGWTIISNASGVIRVSNGTDQIPPNTARTVLIKITGNVIGGPETVSGNLLFSNGVAPGSASGPATPGDITADNSSSSTIQVFNPVPVTLASFSGYLADCKPVLKWTTVSESNSNRFEIERSEVENSNWKTIGMLPAMGNSNTETSYIFKDTENGLSGKHFIYRLRIIDNDGKYSYSTVLKLSITCIERIVSVKQNPVRDNIINLLVSGFEKNPSAELFDVTGKKLFTTTLQNGTNQVEAAKLPNGSYILTVSNNDGFKQSTRIVIAR